MGLKRMRVLNAVGMVGLTLFSGCVSQYGFEADQLSQQAATSPDGISVVVAGPDAPVPIPSIIAPVPSPNASPNPSPAPSPSPSVIVDLPPPNSDICVDNPEADACVRTPVVTTAGVVTILFTVSQIPQGAASLILANAIKYASPVANPKILFLKDYATNGEDEGDSGYIRETLLAGYQVEHRVISSNGLKPNEVEGKDLVIVSNPGHPLTHYETLTTLQGFKGGVILIGDDMANGSWFSNEPLTGLKFIDNGTSLSCDGRSYGFDNLGGYNYQVSMNEEFLPGIPEEFKHYEYGNDLDHVEIVPGVQVLATAGGAPGTCNVGQRPAIVRRQK